jgi:hypothetical protein
MKKANVPALVACILFAAITASACGDKLLHLSRIHRLRVTAGNGAVVIFSRPGSLLENVASLHLDKAFQEEGYHLLLVNNDRELALAIQSGVANVVITDVADVPLLQGMTSPAAYMVIPAVAKGDRHGGIDAAQYPAVIRAPAKPVAFVDALERAFDSKWARQTAKLQPVSRPTR